jgi:hypothetical protein
MSTPRHLAAVAGLFIAGACGVALAAAPVPAFTAHYQVLQNGAPIGRATLSLAPAADGAWIFTTDSRGTQGLASLLAASTREVSTFRWVGGLPQGESYDYTMQSALKNQRRAVRFDWSSHTIEVDDRGTHRYATQPGTLERHTVPLALAAGLAAGKTTFTLPVAVRDRVELQHFAAQGHAAVQVPAGTFDATAVSRTDGDGDFEAWFAPGKVPAPVKIEQRGKSPFVLELQDWSRS